MERQRLVSFVLRGVASILGPVLIAQATPGVVRAADVEVQPKIYALVIGVTDYGPNAGTASKAASGAAEFTKVVEATYGREAVKHLLIDKAATPSAVWNALEEIRSLTPGSLAIIYFAGHAVRKQYSGGATLFLRLYGSTATEYFGKSVEVDEFWKALLFTKQTTAMIFLDCCYAGGDQRDFYRRMLSDNVDIRAFLMSASSKYEPATGDIFTNALIEVWKGAHSGAGHCISLFDFQQAVVDLVQQRDHGYMTPGYAYQTRNRIQRCLLQMNQPSSLLMITFPDGCSAGVNILLNNRPVVKGYNYETEGFYVCQISYTDPVEVEVTGPKDRILAGPSKLNPREMRNRIIEFPVKVPRELATSDASANRLESRAYLQVAQSVEAYGANSSTYYAQAATKLHAAVRLADTRWLRNKAHAYAPENVLLAYAAGARELPDDVRLAGAKEPNETLQVARRLESMGAYRAAAALCADVAGRLDRGVVLEGTSRDDLLLRAVGNLKLAQEAEPGPGRVFIADPSPERLSFPQRSALKLVKESTPPALASAWQDMPTNDWEWITFSGFAPSEAQERVLAALTSVGIDRKVVMNEVTALTAKQMATLASNESFGKPLLVNYYRGASKDYSAAEDWAATAMRIADRGNWRFPTGLAGNQYKWERYRVSFKANDVDIAADGLFSAQKFAASKPGFGTKMDMTSIYVLPSGEEPAYFSANDSVKLPGPFGRVIVAKDLPTAVGYTTTKPGFLSRFKDGLNYIWLGKDGAFEEQKFTCSAPVDHASHHWTNLFPDKATVKIYEFVPSFPAVSKVE